MTTASSFHSWLPRLLAFCSRKDHSPIRSRRREIVSAALTCGPRVGKEIEDLKLPPDTVLVSIRRGNRVIIPRGDTMLSAEDRVLAATAPVNVAAPRQALKKQLVTGHAPKAPV